MRKRERKKTIAYVMLTGTLIEGESERERGR